MKMDIVAGSKNDEFFTPTYAIKPILKYIKPDTTIWCPFDTEQSNFVKELRRGGIKLSQHILSKGEISLRPNRQNVII